MNTNKIVASGVVAISLLMGASVAFAQTYYPSSSYAQGYGGAPYDYGVASSGACVNLSNDLSYGSRGSDVSSLQRFLVSQNYPGSGSWMVTGYFGTATVAAVRNFQQAQGLPMSGAVDSATRAAMSRVGCLSDQGLYGRSDSPYSNNYSGSYPYSYPYDTTYPYTSSYATLPYISSMSQNSGVPGGLVTLYGTGFDFSNNTVYFGSQALPNIPSGNGTSLTFTIPSYYGSATTQSVQVYVSNPRGRSNPLIFTTNPYGPIYSYPYTYQNQSPCSYGACNCSTLLLDCSNLPLAITFLSPNSGATGANVSISGTGIGRSSITIHFGPVLLTNLTSRDGSYVSFTVPTYLYGPNSAPIAPGTYPVSITNGLGVTSNALPFTITSSPGAVSGAPSLISLSPFNGSVGSQIVITGSGFSALDNTVHFGIGGTLHVPSQNGTQIYYTVPSYLAPCDTVTQVGVCAQYIQPVAPDSYPISITNQNGSSNTLNFRVL